MSDAETISIRAAHPDEAAQLSGIARAAKRHWGYSEDLISLWLDDLTVSPQFIAGHDVHCAVHDSDVLGFYALSHVGDEFELEHMWVDPQYIRRGIGARLFQHATETVRSHGGSVLEIASDPNAEGFYLKMGARVIGSVPSKPDGRTLPLLTLVIESTQAASR
jgi:GNAT superfamily N-acetyltransferase